MVLIPNWGGDYQGTGLVKLVLNVVAVILNCRFTTSIAFHYVLHDLRAGRGIGTASLEAKLL